MMTRSQLQSTSVCLPFLVERLFFYFASLSPTKYRFFCLLNTDMFHLSVLETKGMRCHEHQPHTGGDIGRTVNKEVS
jgi:hypothetical protein